MSPDCRGIIRTMLGSMIVLASLTASAEVKRNGAILPGGDSKQPINIEAGKLDYFDKEQKLIYTGSVVASQGTSRLKSSVLTISLAPKTPATTAQAGDAAGGATANQVQHMVATGPVTMVQKDQVGTGDNAVYDRIANTVVLTGNVVLTQGENITKGDKLVYDLKSGHATVTGKRVSGMFKTSNDSPAPDAGTKGEAGASPRSSTRSSSR